MSGELRGQLSFPGPHRVPIPFCHPEVTVATFMVVLLAVPGGSPKRGAEQDRGLAAQDATRPCSAWTVSLALAAVG